MTETSYPFTASTISQAQWQSMAKLFGNTGVAPNIGTECAVQAFGSAMSVSVGVGSALVEGFFYNTDFQVVVPIAAANATNPRIDTIVLRLNRTSNTVTAVVVAGTPAASPAQPTLNATSALFDFPLADVLVGAAVGVIAPGAVTDRRALSGVRGFPVGTTDAQTLTNKTLGTGTVLPQGSLVYRYNRALFANGSFNGSTTEWFVTGISAISAQQHLVISAARDLGSGVERFYPVKGHDGSSNVFITNDDGALAAAQTIRVTVVVPYAAVQ